MSTQNLNDRARDLFPASISGIRGAGPSPLANAAIESIWIATAAELGFRVARTRESDASSDGRGTIAIGQDDVLDEDDAVAQLIFHELCHAIAEGEQALSLPDWGLENRPDHVVREHACLRFAADLAGAFGLRRAMAPTTEYRVYYDALPDEPLAPMANDEAVAIAAAARARFLSSRFRAPLEAALAQTAALAQLSAGGTHPAGFAWGPPHETCGSCAWMYRGGRGPAVPRCRQTAAAVGDGTRIDPGTRACARWEPPVDCQGCGACCREAYHSVTVSVRDPVVWREPTLIVRNGHRFEILREGARCAALAVTPDAKPHYACSIYDNRPQPCRDFAANGRHCLEARRRVGLTAGKS
jgi:hypothetical protein